MSWTNHFWKENKIRTGKTLDMIEDHRSLPQLRRPTQNTLVMNDFKHVRIKFWEKSGVEECGDPVAKFWRLIFNGLREVKVTFSSVNCFFPITNLLFWSLKHKISRRLADDTHSETNLTEMSSSKYKTTSHRKSLKVFCCYSENFTCFLVTNKFWNFQQRVVIYSDHDSARRQDYSNIINEL